MYDNKGNPVVTDQTSHSFRPSSFPVNSIIELWDETIVVGSNSPNITRFSLQPHFQSLQIFKGHRAAIKSLVELDDRSFLSSSADNKIKKWDWTVSESDSCVFTINNTYCTTCMVVLRRSNSDIFNFNNSLKDDEVILATGGLDARVRLWKMSDQTCFRELNTNSLVRCICELSSGYVAAGCDDGKIVLWNISDARFRDPNYCVSSSRLIHSDRVTGIAEIEESVVMSCSDDFTAAVWNIDSSRDVLRHSTGKSCYCASVLSNGLFVIGTDI